MRNWQLPPSPPLPQNSDGKEESKKKIVVCAATRLGRVDRTVADTTPSSSSCHLFFPFLNLRQNKLQIIRFSFTVNTIFNVPFFVRLFGSGGGGGVSAARVMP